MHTQLNFGYLLHDRERERDAHVEQGRRLRALRGSDGSSSRSLIGRWRESNRVLSLRWNLASLRQDSEAAAEAA